MAVKLPNAECLQFWADLARTTTYVKIKDATSGFYQLRPPPRGTRPEHNEFGFPRSGLSHSVRVSSICTIDALLFIDDWFITVVWEMDPRLRLCSK